jgi:hypothetical protein
MTRIADGNVAATWANSLTPEHLKVLDIVERGLAFWDGPFDVVGAIRFVDELIRLGLVKEAARKFRLTELATIFLRDPNGGRQARPSNLAPIASLKGRASFAVRAPKMDYRSRSVRRFRPQLS